MDPVPPDPVGRDSSAEASPHSHPPGQDGPESSAPRREAPWLPLLGALAFLAFLLFPRARAHATLVWTFSGVAAALAIWNVVLWTTAARAGRRFGIEFAAIKAHWVQGLVQFCIYVYWGWYSREVYAQAPLILAQVLFLYVFDGLLSWTRGRSWRIGFGPLPVIFSTNLLLWFRDESFFLQFAMVTTGALGKEFIKWRRDGRWTHIFNPSVFGQSLFGLALIATATTRDFTLGEEIAFSFERLPDIFPVLFVVGLVVQYLFSVTLMTLAATAALCALNLSYTQITGAYLFTTINIGATVFLGLHLLVTDPSTSPRTNLGRVIFGALYGLLYSLLFGFFEGRGIPLFWDKLLPVPFLNLCVPLIDRLSRSGLVGRFNARWESAFAPRRANLLHMACWSALFIWMMATGFVEGQHEGRSIAFWRKAYKEGRHDAGDTLLRMVAYGATHESGEACNMLGKLYLEGELVPQDDAAAAHYFAEACELGDPIGCENVVGQFLFKQRARSPEDVTRAFEHLEKGRDRSPGGMAYFLLGFAYESGFGREHDWKHALELYEEGCRRGNAEACKGRARIEEFGGAARPIPLRKGDEREAGSTPSPQSDGSAAKRDGE